MTEAEWLARENPSTMLGFIHWSLDELSSAEQERLARSIDRKEQLFTVACCRRIWFLIDNADARGCVEVAERHADGLATDEELQAAEARVTEIWMKNGFDLALKACRGVCGRARSHDIRLDASNAAIHWHVANHQDAELRIIYNQEDEADRQLIRDIFGNPFRPVACSSSWRTDTVLTLARQMYDSRDFSAMPILADALQGAGCNNADILDHCRGDGPHVRGCWVVDLVLGKE